MEVVPMLACVLVDQAVRLGRWVPGPLLEFERRENKKDRKIQWRPCVQDSLVQQAILDVLLPVLKPRLILDTYSGIKGRGPKLAMRRMSHLFRSIDQRTQGKFWVYTLDIHHYYPSIKPEILKRVLRHHIADKFLLHLADLIIDSYVDGLPFGDILSPLFANVYLSGLDRLAKEKYRFKCYGRYCDNIVVAHEDKKKLEAFQKEAKQYLWTELGLTVNRNEQIFPHKRGAVEFVGIMFNGHGMRLRKKTERRFRRAAMRFRTYPTMKNYRSLASYWGMCVNRPGGEKFWTSVLGKPLKALRNDILDLSPAKKRKDAESVTLRKLCESHARENQNAQTVYYEDILDIFSPNLKPDFATVWLEDWKRNSAYLRKELKERILDNSLYMPRSPNVQARSRGRPGRVRYPPPTTNIQTRGMT